MFILKVLGTSALLILVGAYICLRLIERQADSLFGHYYDHKKSKDEETYDEVNPIWKDR